MENKKAEPILTLNRVNKYFKKQGTLFKAINEATFEVHQGDFFGIIGESGSGKSTTGKMIIRLLDTNGGTIIFDNNLISQKKISKKTNRWLTQTMQMIFQDPMSSLNPKKNVLNLISEPLRINKKLKAEAKELIRQHGVINPYFQYTYREQDYLRSAEFLHQYYEPLIALYQTAIQKIKTYSFADDENAEELLYDLSSFLAEIEEEGKKINDNIYHYAKSIKDIFYECYRKHTNQENHPLEVQLFNAIENKKAIRKYKHNSHEYWYLIEKQHNLKKEMEQYTQEINETYVKQARTFLQSISESYKADLKLLKQELSITRHYVSTLYIKAQVLNLMIFIEAFDELKQLNFLSISEIQEATNQLKTAIDHELAPLLKMVLDLKDKEKEKENFFNKIVRLKPISQAEIDLINQADVVQLHQNTQLEQIIIKKFSEYQTEYFALINEIKAMISQIERTLEEYQSVDLSDLFTIHAIIHDAQRISYIAEMQYQTKLNQFNQEQQDIQKQLALISANRFQWKRSSEAKMSVENYRKAVKNVTSCQQACQQHYKTDIAAFKAQTQPKIDAFHRLQRQKVRQLNQLRWQYKLQVFLLGQRAQKYLWKLNKGSLLNFWEQRKNLHREVMTKIKNQSALKFEFITTMEEVTLFRSLRTKSWLLRRLNKRFLVQVLTRQKVYEALTSVGLKNEHAYRYPHEFSGGQRQRIVIARALINNPKLIIADEPISALDVSIQAQVVNIMKNLAKEKGITFLFIAHDLSMVNYACNRMIIMHNGQIVEKGNTDEIFRNPVHPYTLSLIKAAPQLSKIHVDLASFSSLENYTANYSIANKPMFHEIKTDSEHFVYGTADQLARWQHH